MTDLAEKIRRRGDDLLPKSGFHFDRPLVLFQSDDWGRVGVRDQEGLAQLRSAGLNLGEQPYDSYTLETADDLGRLADILAKHRDSIGCTPCLGMNFILFNLDFAKIRARGFRRVDFVPLSAGLPEGWKRPGLFESYREGIARELFRPALHGTTHFCRAAIERQLAEDDDKAGLLRVLWQAGTPYIHWRMHWIGYEYWDPAQAEDERFLPRDLQRELIGWAVGEFTRMFLKLPVSACAPGYRANSDTHRGWAQHGIRVAQNGPGVPMPPYIDRHGILQVTRSVDFEPATDPAFSVDACVQQAESCFRQGLPAIVSLHSINFHSTLRDFRSQTLPALDEFLTALESKHDNLLYLRDEDLYELINRGMYSTPAGTARLNVRKKSFTKWGILRRGKR